MFVVLPEIHPRPINHTSIHCGNNKRKNNCHSTRHIRVKSLRAAAIICRDFIERNELSLHGWSGGQVYEGAQMVAEVCHNGSVWSHDGRELEV